MNKFSLTLNNSFNLHIKVQGWSQFRLTGLYGEPDRTKRRATWDLIRKLSGDSDKPWCIIGDMNNILSRSEKKGGRRYPNWLVQGFKDVVEECELSDLDMWWYPFTWERGHGTAEWVEIRLDRALVTKSWTDIFQDTKLSNMEVSTSDHTPLFLEPFITRQLERHRSFKFENAWLREPMCRKIVEDVWENHKEKPLQYKLKSCSKTLSEWGKEITGSFRTRIAHSNRIIKRTKGRRDEFSVKQFREENKKLTETLTQQEVFLKQRSKQLWLREGDQNSKKFHSTAKARRRTNHIKSLLDGEGREVDWETGLPETMENYFKELFSASDTEWNEVVNCVSSSITAEQNANLIRES